MRTLTLVAPAAGACGGDYTRYPSHRSLWMNVTCLTCGMGIVTPCTDSTSMPDTISQCCTADEGYTLIFVNSMQSPLGTSKDAFVIDGIVDTAGWTNTSPEYDASGLNLKGSCKGRSLLTESDAHCMAECPGERDVPVTLVECVVEDHSTKRAIVDCDANKQNLLEPLRDDRAVKKFLLPPSRNLRVTVGVSARPLFEEVEGEDVADDMFHAEVDEYPFPSDAENDINDDDRKNWRLEEDWRQRDSETVQKVARRRDAETVGQYRAQQYQSPKKKKTKKRRNETVQRVVNLHLKLSDDDDTEKKFDPEMVKPLDGFKNAW